MADMALKSYPESGNSYNFWPLMYVQDHLKSKREKKENSSLGKTYISYAKVGQQ